MGLLFVFFPGNKCGSLCLHSEHQQTDSDEFSLLFSSGNVFKGSNCVYSVSDGTCGKAQLQIRSSSPQLYLAESRHNPHLTEQRDLYLGIKILTTALSYQGLFMIVFYGWKLQNICRDFMGGGKKGDKWAELNLKMALGHFAVSGKFSGSGNSRTEVPQNLWLPPNRWK